MHDHTEPVIAEIDQRRRIERIKRRWHFVSIFVAVQTDLSYMAARVKSGNNISTGFNFRISNNVLIYRVTSFMQL